MTGATAAPAAAGTTASIARARGRPGAFGPALARAGAVNTTGAEQGARPAGPRGTLSSWWRDAAARQGLGRHGVEIGPLAPAPDRPANATPDVAEVEATMAGSLFPASAIDQLAIQVRRERDRPSIELGFGPEVSVRITRHEDGLELLLNTGAGSQAAADAELPRLVAGLRARGLRVKRARAQARDGDGDETPSALTPPRGSDRTAATLRPGGTVAKW